MLNLPLPAERHSCQVYDYTASHSRLVIRLDGWDMPRFYLYFSAVRYFSGPTFWDGANFQIASKEQCMATMQRVGLLKKLSQPDRYNLYMINENDIEVKIISPTFSLSTQEPYY